MNILSMGNTNRMICLFIGIEYVLSLMILILNIELELFINFKRHNIIYKVVML